MELQGGALTVDAANLKEQLYGLKRILHDLKPRRNSHLKEREGGDVQDKSLVPWEASLAGQEYSLQPEATARS